MKPEAVTVRMPVEAGREILALIDSIYAQRQRIVDLAGFKQLPDSARLERNGEAFWPDEALRIAEAEALESAGRNPNHGRFR